MCVRKRVREHAYHFVEVRKKKDEIHARKMGMSGLRNVKLKVSTVKRN